MDSRIALAAGTQLHFRNAEGGAVRYTIIKEIGRGGSCIVYDAYYETNTGDKKQVRMKECCPLKLRLTRTAAGSLQADAADAEAFEAAQKKFRSDFSLGNGLFYAQGLYDAITNTIDIYCGNGTTYLVSAFSPENTLAAYQPENLRVCITLVKQVAQILQRIHDAGYLYLDIKPDNVLVLDSYATRVQLFDFDSLIPLGADGQWACADPSRVRVSFSKGFAAIELQTGKVKKLGRHTDVYGVGAMLFYLLFGAAPSAADCEPAAHYDFTKSKYAKEQYPDKLFFALTDFFHAALANFYLDRYPDMAKVIGALTEIEALCDPAKPYIRSSIIIPPAAAFGRQKELQALSAWLCDPGCPCIFVTGMGGIGKSTLVRAFLAQHSEDFDSMLYLPYRGSLARTLTDDQAALIHTVEKSDKETLEEYYRRKLRAFTQILRGKKAILVIDNYPGEIHAALADVIAVGWKVILISRKTPADGAYPHIPVAALSAQEDLYLLFEHNLGAKLQPADQAYLDNILDKIDGHTLILELIAKQIKSSYLTLRQASELVDTHGFAAMAPEKVLYRKDNAVYPETIRNILTALFEADQLSAKMQDLVKVLSLIGSAGVEISLLHDILSIASKEDANALIRDGWMVLEGKILSLHPVIQETVHCWDWSAGAKAYALRLMEYLFREIQVESHRQDYPKKLLWGMEIARQQQRKHPWLQKWFDRFTRRHGLLGDTLRERYDRCDDPSPADRRKLTLLLQLSEGILENCKREPLLRQESVYPELLFQAVINMPRYREDFILEGAEELLADPRSQNGFAIMRLYDCVLSVYQERKDFSAASAKLKEAEAVAKKFGHSYIWAQYYDLMTAFYDHVLGGAYASEEPDEELLMRKILDTVDKTIRCARRSRLPGSKILLAKTLLSKATMLIRSEPERKKQIDRLLSEAEKIVFAETQPYAEVRCIYYLVKAWYATLVVPSFEDTLLSIGKATEISLRIAPTDLDEIDNRIVPCADMLCVWQKYAFSAKLLMEGIQICEKSGSVVPYLRKKMELYRYLLDVCWEWEKKDLCRQIVAQIDEGNQKYRAVGVQVAIPEDLRALLSSDDEIP